MSKLFQPVVEARYGNLFGGGGGGGGVGGGGVAGSSFPQPSTDYSGGVDPTRNNYSSAMGRIDQTLTPVKPPYELPEEFKQAMARRFPGYDRTGPAPLAPPPAPIERPQAGGGGLDREGLELFINDILHRRDRQRFRENNSDSIERGFLSGLFG